MIDQLSIRTNVGTTFGPFGGNGGTAFDFAAPDGTEVIGFWGRSGGLLDAVGICVRPVTRSAPVHAPGTLVGFGMDSKLYVRKTLNDTWTVVRRSSLASPIAGNIAVAAGVAVARNGEVFGIVKEAIPLGGLFGIPTRNNRLWKRATLESVWSGPVGPGSFLAITAMGDGLLGVGTDNFLYKVDTSGNPNQVPNSGSVVGVAVARNGEIFGLGMDRTLWKRATLNGTWSGPIGSGLYLAITAMGDGLLGVGTDNFLYTIDTNGNPSKVPNSDSVLAVACYQ